MSQQKLLEMEQNINYHFHHKDLLKQALRHSSFSNERKWSKLSNNERLEFLGDAVLELVSSEFLYRKFPKKLEGELSRTRASLVCEQSLFLCTEKLKLGKFLYLGRGEESSGGRLRASILTDALEAIIGAIYLDGGLEPAKEFILNHILNDIESKQLFYDAKTILQEKVQQKFKEPLQYRLVHEIGPDHDKEFSMEVSIGEKVIGKGIGRSKKSAEQEAAYDAIISGNI